MFYVFDTKLYFNMIRRKRPASVLRNHIIFYTSRDRDYNIIIIIVVVGIGVPTETRQTDKRRAQWAE